MHDACTVTTHTKNQPPASTTTTQKQPGLFRALRSAHHVLPIREKKSFGGYAVERLFGKAKHIMTALRRKMDPDSLNMFLFIKTNRNL
jgi:hypothetical protein